MTIAAQIVHQAAAQGLTITTAESCTGGMVAVAITDVAGSSAMFERGFVTYSNQAKIDLLGVMPATLDAHGAVSAQTAAEMAQGARSAAQADIAVAITGIAGPGGSDHKPEGLVFIGLADRYGVQVVRHEFGPQGRAANRDSSREAALALILTALDSISPEN